jgi:hypothetical protein
MGLDTKTYWLTDRQSQCDFDCWQNTEDEVGSRKWSLQHVASSLFAVATWLRLALSKGPNWVGVLFPPFTWGRKHPVSETSCFLVSRIPDDGKVQKPSNPVRLLSSEGINNYKLLQFLLLTASFHLHPCIITFSTWRRSCKVTRKTDIGRDLVCLDICYHAESRVAHRDVTAKVLHSSNRICPSVRI